MRRWKDNFTLSLMYENFMDLQGWMWARNDETSRKKGGNAWEWQDVSELLKNKQVSGYGEQTFYNHL